MIIFIGEITQRVKVQSAFFVITPPSLLIDTICFCEVVSQLYFLLMNTL